MKMIKKLHIKTIKRNLINDNYCSTINYYLIVLLSLFFLPLSNIKAQTYLLFDSTNTVISNKVLQYDIAGEFIYVECDSLSKGAIFTTFSDYTGLAQTDTMIVNREWQSESSSMIITEYLRYRHGILVEYSDFKEHSLNGYTLFLNGNINYHIPSDYIPSIESNDAIDLASNDAITTYEYFLIDTNFVELDTLYDTTYHFHTTTLAWGNDTLEYYLSLDFDSTYGTGTFEPTAELVYGRFYHDEDSIYYRLSWKIFVATVNHDTSYNEFTYYIDAITSEILKKEENVGRGSTGTFNHLYYGQRDIQHKWIGSTYKYILQSTDQKHVKTHTIKTLNKFGVRSKQWDQNRLVNNSSGNWGNNYWDATAAHYSVTTGLDYIRIFHNEIFPGEIRVTTHGMGNDWAAAWKIGTPNGYDYISVGDLNGVYYGQVDVMTHELTHAFINRMGKIPFSPEGWAIEEAFSDMLGLNANRWANPSQWSWEFPAHGGFPVRNMMNPTLIPTNRANKWGAPCYLPTQYPTIYKGPNWYTSPAGEQECAQRGVYINMTVMTKWYYLLEQGGSQNGYLVNGIGETKARNLIWHTFKNYGGSNVNFQTLRAKTLASAAELFGLCQTEYLDICNAFSAIGVYGTCCFTQNHPVCYDFTPPIDEVFTELSTDKIENTDKNSIYPNPFHNTINFSFTSVKENIHIIAYDMQGKMVFNQKYTDKKEIQLDMSELAEGLYQFKVEVNGVTQLYKLVKI